MLEEKDVIGYDLRSGPPHEAQEVGVYFAAPGPVPEGGFQVFYTVVINLSKNNVLGLATLLAQHAEPVVEGFHFQGFEDAGPARESPRSITAKT